MHELYFATPQDVDLAGLCRAHGVPYRLVGTEAELEEVLRDWDGSSQVLEVAVDRSRARALSRAVAEAASE